MLEGLGNVVVKEVKELIRDPKILVGMIVVPLLLFPFMGFAIRVATQTAVESAKTMSIGIINNDDDGTYAQGLIAMFSSSKVAVVRLSVTDIHQVEETAQETNMTAIVVIPNGFSENITNNATATVYVYGVFRGMGIVETAGPATAVSVISVFSDYLALGKVGNNPAVLDPIIASQESIVKGKVVNVSPTSLSSFVLSQYLGLPIGITVLLVFAMQIAATSVASEKEEKTLETMLSMPVGRFTILLGKLAGSVIAAAVGALAYVIGFNYYIGSIALATSSTQPAIDLASIGLAPTLTAYIVLGASLFVALVSALALAIAVSSFAEDVRSAQAIVGYFYFILFVPMIFLMYTDISTLPLSLRLIILAIPYTHPMLAARASFTGDYTTAVLGIVYVTAFTLIVLYIAARIFTTEKIMTARIRFRRRKRAEE